MIHTLFDIILLGGICAVHHRMLHTLRGGRFDCLLTLISLKMKHPRPLQVCTIVCIIYDAHRGRGDQTIVPCRIARKNFVESQFCLREAIEVSVLQYVTETLILYILALSLVASVIEIKNIQNKLNFLLKKTIKPVNEVIICTSITFF